MISTVAQRVGRTIRQLRLAEGLTQKELADRAGVDPSYIGKIERGEKLKVLERLYRIAQGLGKSLTALFG